MFKAQFTSPDQRPGIEFQTRPGAILNLNVITYRPFNIISIRIQH